MIRGCSWLSALGHYNVNAMSKTRLHGGLQRTTKCVTSLPRVLSPYSLRIFSVFLAFLVYSLRILGLPRVFSPCSWPPSFSLRILFVFSPYSWSPSFSLRILAVFLPFLVFSPYSISSCSLRILGLPRVFSPYSLRIPALFVFSPYSR